MNEHLEHHGILGQKWGKRNGPPYPLDADDHSASERKAGYRLSIRKAETKDTKRNKDTETNNKHQGLTDSQKRAIKIGAAVCAGALAAGGIGYLAYKSDYVKKLADVGSASFHESHNVEYDWGEHWSSTYGDIRVTRHGCDSMGSKGPELNDISEVIPNWKSTGKYGDRCDLDELNPYRREDPNNCQNAAIAILSRFKGYDNVVAGLNTGTNEDGVSIKVGGSLDDVLKCFRTKEGVDLAATERVKSIPKSATTSQYALTRQLMDKYKWPEGSYGYGQANIPTKNNEERNHAFVWQIRGGKIHFYDSINGECDYYVNDINHKDPKFSMFRVDDIDIVESEARKFVQRK